MNIYVVYACMCVYEHICICIHTQRSAFEIYFDTAISIFFFYFVCKQTKYNEHICVCEYTNIYMYTYIHTCTNIVGIYKYLIKYLCIHVCSVCVGSTHTHTHTRVVFYAREHTHAHTECTIHVLTKRIQT